MPIGIIIVYIISKICRAERLDPNHSAVVHQLSIHTSDVLCILLFLCNYDPGLLCNLQGTAASQAPKLHMQHCLSAAWKAAALKSL